VRNLRQGKLLGIVVSSSLGIFHAARSVLCRDFHKIMAVI
jgi:hypothetical protein